MERLFTALARVGKGHQPSYQEYRRGGEMKPIEIIKNAISSDIPVIGWGPPGTGKTEAMKALAKESGVHMITLIGAGMDYGDVCGYRVPNQSKSELTLFPPDWALEAKKSLSEGVETWLYIDEVSCCSPSIQAAFLRVIYDRVAGGVDLKGVRIISSANDAETAADNGILSAAMAGRFAHVKWSLDPIDWIAGELSGWGNEKSAAHNRAASAVCSYIKRNTNALLCVPKDIEKAGEAWPSPRSWSHAIRMMSLSRREDWASVASACVGNAAASEFYTYVQAMSLPDPEDILSGKASIPSRGDEAFAALSSLVGLVLSRHDDRDARIRKAWKIFGSLRPDIVMIPARILIRGEPEIETKEMISLGLKIHSVT
jgi:hypothetical protein